MSRGLACVLHAIMLVLAAGGCESVPELTFAEVDAAADAPDTGLADVDAGAVCPESPPPGTSVCCGSVACEGLCAGQCDACASKCTAPGEFCCAKNNNVLCLSAGALCH